MFRVITEGFGLGLSTGAYCLGSCLPFFAPYLVSEGRPGIRDNIYSVLMFLSGRLCAYVLFSVVASALGILFEPKVPPSLASAALLFTSLAMILYALVKNFPAFRICGWAERRLPARRFPFVLGFLVGINICPPFLVGLARLLEMRDVALGVLLFLAFFAGTSFFMLPLAALGPLGKIERLRSVGMIAALLSGVWFFIIAVLRLIG